MKQTEKEAIAAKLRTYVDSKESQNAAAHYIVAHDLTVSKAEEYIETLLHPAPSRSKPTFLLKDIRFFLNTVTRGLALMQSAGVKAACEDGVREHLAASCGGDVRKALNAVELLMTASRIRDGILTITLEDARLVAQRSAMRYDREGDDHYDIASALMKSLRGSDPDAALHYLARLLEAGDLITAIRRILCSASEDIGLAYPMAVPIVKACVDNALQLGLPEAKLPLAEAVILLATAPKSNTACMAIDAALADVRAGRTGSIPRELQNVHADSAGQEREQGYKYPHSFPRHWVAQQYLPDELTGTRYYEYGDNKTEQAAKRYWDEIKGEGGL